MAAHLRSRQASALAHASRHAGLRSRVLLMCVALASALVLMPHAHAQNNAAQGNGQNAAANNGKNAGNNNGNGAPVSKTAAQRTQEDAQRLLGGPSMAVGGYNMEGATPDAQRYSLLNTERMRAAKPNTQAAGGPSAAVGGNGPEAAAGGAIRRPARGGAAAGGAAQRGGPVNAAAAGGAATAVYSDPYSQRAGRDVFKSPW
ncbi:hypothetical protein G3N95_29035 [Paraburkholderia sp. Tr-20389]|uniref:hypothetical protein n=1 Tax=Paraburkholderia sp. Tr-20389 TaxID=2703903 RepID=UPI00197D5943|nr:hypothetical protein [Paraburkholderia sp. Tr-20389]MBN3757017.1 hypothetical protein [Paraburkholderia sp. Tr-20389]